MGLDSWYYYFFFYHWFSCTNSGSRNIYPYEYSYSKAILDTRGQNGALVKGFFHRSINQFSGTYPGMGHSDSRLNKAALMSILTAMIFSRYWGLDGYNRTWVG